MMSFRYKMFLKDLADHLTCENVETIKFLFASEFPAGKAEKLNSQMKLLNAMDHAKIISKVDTSKLEFLFNTLPRRDLIPKLEKYKKEILNDSEETSSEYIKDSFDESEKNVQLKVLFATENIDDTDSDATISPITTTTTTTTTDKTNLLIVSLDETEKDQAFYSVPSGIFPPPPPAVKKVGMQGTPSAVTPSAVTPSAVTPSAVTPSPVTPSPVTPSPVTPLPRTYSPGTPLESLYPGTPSLGSLSPGTPSPGKVELKTPDFFRKTKSIPSKSPNTEIIPELIQPPNHSRQISSHQVRPEEYPMDQRPHGDCIIFSNRFDGGVKLPNGVVLNKRVGTEKDVMYLQQTFEYLKFIVTVHRNLSAGDLMDTLKSYAKQKEQENKDCFVVCILSHGYDGGIYGNDGVMLSSKQLKSIFTGDNCPSLINKPKLFFIQACQGDDDGKGVKLEPDGPSTHIVQDHLGESGSEEVGHTGVVLEDIISIDADFLFFMATTPGTISWRDPVKGSWFVQTLCEVFQQNAHAWSLMDMLLTVNNNIAMMKQTVDDGYTMTMAKQMSDLGKNTLRKKLYFFPESREELGFSNGQTTPLP